MNIIFGDGLNLMPEKYTRLELDTFKIVDTGQVITAYCLVETIPLAEFPKVEDNKNLHGKLIENYKKQNWTFCEDAISSLLGAWSGEVDSFYLDLQARVDQYKQNPPPPSWDGIIEKF